MVSSLVVSRALEWPILIPPYRDDSLRIAEIAAAVKSIRKSGEYLLLAEGKVLSFNGRRCESQGNSIAPRHRSARAARKSEGAL